MTEALFGPALFDVELPVPEGLTDGSGHPAGKRFDVYRNNVVVALTEALQTGFPVLQKLVGVENFKRLAGLFLRAHPPNSPVMMFYGSAMPQFLETFEPLAHVPYLPDVARLELALRRSYHAPDDTPASGLESLSEDSRVVLARSAHYLPSSWPIWGIWHFNTAPSAPHPREIPQHIIVLRPEFDPTPHALSPAEGAWVQSVQTGLTLGQAMDQAGRIDTNFDVSHILGLLVQNHGISDILS